MFQAIPVARLALAASLTLTSAALAAPQVSGELTVDGKSTVLNHGLALETTMGGGDDPVTYVRLTEKAAGKSVRDEMDVLAGKAGALFGIHLHASGKVFQALALRPAADSSFSTTIPKESVKVTAFKIADQEIAATVENAGELNVDGHTWKFKFVMKLPIESR